MSATVQQLRSILKKMNIYPHVEALSDAENLFTAGVLDSLILIQFVLAIEDQFKVRLGNDDISYDQFQSFKSISTLLETKYKKS